MKMEATQKEGFKSNFMIEELLKPDSFHNNVIKSRNKNEISHPQNHQSKKLKQKVLFTPGEELPAWIFCTRYSDRPSAGSRHKRPRKKAPDSLSFPTTSAPPSPSSADPSSSSSNSNNKRPRTAFTAEQLTGLQSAFAANPYLTEDRRAGLAGKLGLGQSQVKIWFQNKRAKAKRKTRKEIVNLS